LVLVEVYWCFSVGYWVYKQCYYELLIVGGVGVFLSEMLDGLS